MKKTLSVFLSFLLALLFCACGIEKGEYTASSFSVSQSVSQTETANQTESETSSLSSETISSAFSGAETSVITSVQTTTALNTTEQRSVISTTEKTTFESKTEQETATTEKTTQQNTITCFVTIDCRNIQKNLSSLKKGKQSFVPKNGFILKNAAVTLSNGETAFDALKKACRKNVCTDNCKYCQKGGIQIESSYTPAYKSYYVEGIHQLYEKDCGSLSGWMYNVDGTYPDVSSSVYNLKGGEKITFAYTVSMGDDLT